jgi:GTP cyclohydrolase IA
MPTATQLTLVGAGPQEPAQLRPSADEAAGAVRLLLAHLGYDCADAGMAGTPGRVVRALAEMTAGQHLDPAGPLSRTFRSNADADHDELIVQTGIEFVALCEHHLMPFTGTATVAYLPRPDAPVVGLSKLGRLVDIYARRLTMQERMTRQITAALDANLDTLGSACIIRSTHACMGLRGVRKPNAVTITSSLTGALREDERSRAELLALVGGV